MKNLLKTVYIILNILALVLNIIGRKYLKKINEGESKNEEYYKKGTSFLLAFYNVLIISIILGGIILFFL